METFLSHILSSLAKTILRTSDCIIPTSSDGSDFDRIGINMLPLIPIDVPRNKTDRAVRALGRNINSLEYFHFIAQKNIERSESELKELIEGQFDFKIEDISNFNYEDYLEYLFYFQNRETSYSYRDLQVIREIEEGFSKVHQSRFAAKKILQRIKRLIKVWINNPINLRDIHRIKTPHLFKNLDDYHSPAFSYLLSNN